MDRQLSFSRIAARSSRLMRFTLIVIVLAFFLSSVPKKIVQAAAGVLDPTFGNGGKVITDFGGDEDVSTTLIQPDGKIVAIGSAVSGNGFTVARYNTDGTLDLTFGSAGKVATSFFNTTQTANGGVLQPDGKIIVGGTAFKINHYVFALARYNVDGSLDSSFGSGGKVDADLFADDQASAIGLHQDGKIVAVGQTFSNGNNGLAMAQYNPDGSLDSGFGVGGRVFVNNTISGFGGLRLASAFQPDNKIILGGFKPSISTDFAVLRLNADGSIDTSFGTNGEVATDFSTGNDSLFGMALQTDGKIVAVGRTDQSFIARSALARYSSDGSLDTSFGVGGKVVSPSPNNFDELRAVLIQGDGKILTGGSTNAGLLVARYNSDGTFDQTFGSGGRAVIAVGDLVPTVKSLAIQSDGKIIAAGLVFNFDTGLDFVLVRLQGATFDLCLRDDSSGNILQVNLTTGSYQFTNCSGVTLGGIGSIITKGCYVTLQVNGPDRRVLVRIDTCARTGTATIQVFSTATRFTILDRNSADNTCSCSRSS